MRNNPSRNNGSFLVDVATIWLVLALLPIGVASLAIIRAIEIVMDRRKPAHGG